MLKKIIIFVCLILGVSLFCCGIFCAKKSDKIVIQFASWGSESEISILKPILENFEKENPDIKVDFMHIPQNYFQKYIYYMLLILLLMLFLSIINICLFMQMQLFWKIYPNIFLKRNLTIIIRFLLERCHGKPEFMHYQGMFQI